MPMRVGLLAIAALQLAACSAPREPALSDLTPTSETVISINHLDFTPGAMTVAVGTTVTWRNDESITHTLTSGKVSEGRHEDQLACGADT